MSVSNSTRCLFSRSSIPKSRALARGRNFHATSNLLERRRPRFSSITAADMGLVSSSAKEGLRPYEAKEKAALAKRYTPEQLKVIEAGEEAIDPEDILTQGMFRTDPYRLPYLDDLSIMRPVVDKRFQESHALPDNARWMNDREEMDEFSEWMRKATLVGKKTLELDQTSDQEVKNEGAKKKGAPGPNQFAINEEDLKFARSEFLKYMESAPGVTGGTMGSTSLAPALPKIPDMKGQYQTAEEMDPRDPEGKYVRLMKQTGLTLDYILNARVKILVRHNVTNQTRLGKIQSIYCLAIAGDGKGQLGIGEAKGTEQEATMDKARQSALRTMKPVARYEGRTIYGEVEGKVAACEVTLMARPPGFGLRCQHNIFEMARAAGIEDLAARVPRGRNKMNTIKAAYQALLSQKLPDDIARGRGKKLVDVRKVYYGGDQRLSRESLPSAG